MSPPYVLPFHSVVLGLVRRAVGRTSKNMAEVGSGPGAQEEREGTSLSLDTVLEHNIQICSILDQVFWHPRIVPNRIF